MPVKSLQGPIASAVGFWRAVKTGANTVQHEKSVPKPYMTAADANLQSCSEILGGDDARTDHVRGGFPLDTNLLE